MIAFLRHLVIDDFMLKLFSLVLALLFWLTVSFAIQQKEVLPLPAQTLNVEVLTFPNIPLALVSAAGDVRNFKLSTNQAEVTVQGDPRAFQNVQSKDIRAVVDLTGFEPAHPRRRVEVSMPAGVTLLGVRPEEVQVIQLPKPPAR